MHSLIVISKNNFQIIMSSTKHEIFEANIYFESFCFYYSCDRQRYCNISIHFFAVNHFIRRMAKIRISKFANVLSWMMCRPNI